MSRRSQRREEAAREKKAGERNEKGEIQPGPSGRPTPWVSCFHCGRKLFKLPPHVARWMIRGLEIRCPNCKRDTVM